MDGPRDATNPFPIREATQLLFDRLFVATPAQLENVVEEVVNEIHKMIPADAISFYYKILGSRNLDVVKLIHVPVGHRIVAYINQAKNLPVEK